MAREDPEEKKFDYSLTGNLISLERAAGSRMELKQGHELRWPKTLSLPFAIRQGDTVIFRAAVLPFSGPRYPGGFNARQYAERRGLVSYSRIFRVEQLTLKPGPRKPDVWKALRTWCAEKAQRFIKHEETRALMLQMLMGLRSEISEETRAAFRNTGVMHILAVSGLHVGIVYVVLAFVGRLLIPDRGVYRWFLTAFILFFVWSYCALAAMRPSVVRAALMFSFVSMGRLIRREIPLLNSLSAAALVNLSLDPSDLFDLGFQFSYSAVAGIGLLYKPLSSLWNPNIPFLRWLWDLTCVSLSAQAATTGLTLLYFGQFPLLFLLANWVAVPAAAVVIYGTLAFMLSPVHELSFTLGEALEFFIKNLTGFLKTLDDIPRALLLVSEWSPWDTIFLTLILILIVGWVLKPTYRTLKPVLIALLIWQGVLVFKDIVNTGQPFQWFVTGGQEGALQLRKGGQVFWQLSLGAALFSDTAGIIIANGKQTIMVHHTPESLLKADYFKEHNLIHIVNFPINKKDWARIKVLKDQRVVLGPRVSALQALHWRQNYPAGLVGSVNLDGFQILADGPIVF
ncbi:MAG: ComEC/Rec2 family competence protein [Flavobacteriales bacterium]|nr:ComEC/Rec2 family competence protein [Flavobacteriales bacterium]